MSKECSMYHCTLLQIAQTFKTKKQQKAAYKFHFKVALRLLNLKYHSYSLYFKLVIFGLNAFSN
jgi:hypothetical protein